MAKLKCPVCKSEETRQHDPRKTQCTRCSHVALTIEFEAAALYPEPEQSSPAKAPFAPKTKAPEQPVEPSAEK